MAKLTEDQFDLLVLLEECWLKTGDFPPLSFISSKSGLPQEMIMDYMSQEVFQKALKNRGISFLPDERLSPEQLAAIQLLLNISDKRSISAKLDALGIKRSTYYSWKKNPYFMQAYRELGEKLFGESMPEVHQSLVSNAVDGDLKSIELYYKISGRYNDKREEQVDLKRVMDGVVEAVQKVIKDPDQLTALASELEKTFAREVIQHQLEK